MDGLTILGIVATIVGAIVLFVALGAALLDDVCNKVNGVKR